MTHPLWLPRGSVRAILTLSVAITTLYMIAIAREQIPQSLGNVLIVSVAFYYSTRASILPSTETPKKIDTSSNREPAPLFLPAKTVRITLAMIMAISIGIVAFTHQEIPIFIITVFITIIGYVLGMIVKEIIGRLFPPKPGRNKAKEIIGHLQAGIIIAIVVGVCSINIISTFQIFDLDDLVIVFLNQLLELAIGYYFGSRTIR